MNLSEYLELPRELRITHIDLSTPCQCVEKLPCGVYKAPSKNQILSFLGVEDNITNWRSARVCRAHACNKDSTNGWCRNPQHYYLATYSENFMLDKHSGREAMLLGGAYRNPETGECLKLLPSDPRRLSWVCVGALNLPRREKGTAIVFDPLLEKIVMLPMGIIKERGLVSPLKGRKVGKTPFLNPDTNSYEMLTFDEGTLRGWRCSSKGVTRRRVICDICGKSVTANTLSRHKQTHTR
jgi:hypothetical protein